MKIGKYRVHSLLSGGFKLDGGAMFGIIPKLLWSKSNPADELNRISLVTRNLLLVSDSRKILIDTGMGNKWTDKSKEIYDIDFSQFTLERSLKELEIEPSDITDVLLTHLHFDHTGGSTKLENGKLIPSFPNAKYFVAKKNYEWGINATDRDKGSYLKENFQALFENGALHFFSEKEHLFDDEIALLPVNGHTIGQQLFKIFDTTTTLLYCGDLFPTSSHIPLPYIMGYDLQPLITLAEKKELLPTAVEENWKLVFEHDPFFAAATVAKNEKGFSVRERFETL
ncbi:MAG: MBL fold metallo-hydrolase [Ignavibacteriaceae bacterium]|nr:MBL fold metallo-hydrolase [Ignavibacteriaceae bacterium]